MYLLTYYVLGIFLDSAEKYWKIIHGVLAVGLNQNHIKSESWTIFSIIFLVNQNLWSKNMIDFLFV